MSNEWHHRSYDVGDFPSPVEPIVAYGAIYKTAPALLVGQTITVSEPPHELRPGQPGFVDSVEAEIDQQLDLAGQRREQVEAFCCDLNPHSVYRDLAYSHCRRYGSTRYPPPSFLPCSHHHSHAAALMIEHSVPPGEPIVAITLDGMGYGPDRTRWGGEILLADSLNFVRAASLEPQMIPAGDLFVVYPTLALYAILRNPRLEYVLSADAVRSILHTHCAPGLDRLVQDAEGQAESVEDLLSLVERVRASGHRLMTTTSTGRVLDAMASLLGLCHYRSWDGEPAITLDQAAASTVESGAPFEPLTHLTVEPYEGRLVIRTSELCLEAVSALDKGMPTGNIALGVELALAYGVAQAAIQVAHAHAVRTVGFNGGVAYSAGFRRAIGDCVRNAGLELLTANKPGDENIGVGQCAIAAARAHPPRPSERHPALKGMP